MILVAGLPLDGLGELELVDVVHEYLERLFLQFLVSLGTLLHFGLYFGIIVCNQ